MLEPFRQLNACVMSISIRLLSEIRSHATHSYRSTHRRASSASPGACVRRDLLHRATGAAARLPDVMRRAPADDLVLVQRGRAQLGRLVAHPRAMEVDADDGVVTLQGPVLRSEGPRLLRMIAKMGGVREIVNVLDEHLFIL